MRGLGLGALLAALLLLGGASANTFAGGRKLQQLSQHRYTEAGEADDGWTALEGVSASAPPLVTAESIARAKQLDDGVPVQALSGGASPVLIPRAVASHRTTSLSGADARAVASHRTTSLSDADGKASAFASIPPWVFVITFLGAVGAVVILFYFTERMWAKRQESQE